MTRRLPVAERGSVDVANSRARHDAAEAVMPGRIDRRVDGRNDVSRLISGNNAQALKTNLMLVRSAIATCGMRGSHSYFSSRVENSFVAPSPRSFRVCTMPLPGWPPRRTVIMLRKTTPGLSGASIALCSSTGAFVNTQ